MHGQQTLKHLNEKAVADAIIATRKKMDEAALDPALVQAMEEHLAQKALKKAITQ
jgi:hypothetical protein